MTTCRCGHPLDAHPGEHAGMCVMAHCECVAYRLRPLSAARPTSPPRLRDLIAAGRCSKRAKARTLADRVDTSIAALVQELRAERQAAATVRERKPKERSNRAHQPPIACPDCGHVCKNGTGLYAHRRSAHLPVERVACPECGKSCARNGIGAHRYNAHGIRKGAAA